LSPQAVSIKLENIEIKAIKSNISRLMEREWTVGVGLILFFIKSVPRSIPPHPEKFGNSLRSPEHMPILSSQVPAKCRALFVASRSLCCSACTCQQQHHQSLRPFSSPPISQFKDILSLLSFTICLLFLPKGKLTINRSILKVLLSSLITLQHRKGSATLWRESW
jgi:hypothetical protein